MLEMPRMAGRAGAGRGAAGCATQVKPAKRRTKPSIRMNLNPPDCVSRITHRRRKSTLRNEPDPGYYGTTDEAAKKDSLTQSTAGPDRALDACFPWILGCRNARQLAIARAL